jgi:tetratricopeptide (TPR) repeat protein
LTFSIKTIARNLDWKDNYTLFIHDVKISSESAKGNVTAGGILLDKAGTEKDELIKKGYLNQSIKYLDKSLSIYPGYVDALLLAGNAYFQRDKDYNKVYRYYGMIFRQAPGYELAFNNYKIMLAAAKNPIDKKKGYLHILSFHPDDFDANYQLGSTYGKLLNNLDSALIFLNRAVKINPESKDANMDMGVALAMNGDIEKSIPYLEKTVRLDPQNPSNYINLGLSYLKMGYQERANEMFAKAKSLGKPVQ